MDIKDVNINNVGSLTQAQRKSIQRRAIKNVAGFIMLKFFIAIFLNKTTKSLEKRNNKKTTSPFYP